MLLWEIQRATVLSHYVVLSSQVGSSNISEVKIVQCLGFYYKQVLP
jgi:hypothetical protein